MKTKMMIRILTVAGLLAVMLTPHLYARNGIGKERIRGLVVDKDNKPIPDANVVIQYKGYYKLDSVQTGKTTLVITETVTTHKRKTNKKGHFHFMGLATGLWGIKVDHKDFKPGRKQVNLVLGKPAPLVTIKLGDPTQGNVSPNNESLQLSKASQKGKNAAELFDLGERLLENDYTKRAIVCFRLAAKKKPKWSAPYLKLGFAYFNLGDTKKATIFFKKYLRLDPESEDAQTVKDIIASIKEMK